MSEDFPTGTHIEVQNDEVEAVQSEHKAERMDESSEAFHRRMGELMTQCRDFYVFRGAGTKNGIAVEDVPGAVDKIMTQLQTSLDAGRKVAIMFDGDEDNRQKPDVGAVFGLVADLVKDNDNVVAVAAQQESWYYPEEESGELKSATGTPYETFVFPDSTPGGHASLTQSKDLAQYENYKQFFIGPAGAIAGEQLRDLNEKAQGRPEDKKVEVIAIATHNNANLTQEFEDKAKAADEAGDTAKADGFRATLTQREEQPYGMMYGADSYKTFLPNEYSNVDIKFDESLVGEFQDMRTAPLKETYIDDQEKSEAVAYSAKEKRDDGAEARKAIKEYLDERDPNSLEGIPDRIDSAKYQLANEKEYAERIEETAAFLHDHPVSDEYKAGHRTHLTDFDFTPERFIMWEDRVANGLESSAEEEAKIDSWTNRQVLEEGKRHLDTGVLIQTLHRYNGRDADVERVLEEGQRLMADPSTTIVEYVDFLKSEYKAIEFNRRKKDLETASSIIADIRSGKASETSQS